MPGANRDLPIRSRDELLNLRVIRLHEAPPRRKRYVLYWMQQQRRLEHNLALQHAVRRCREQDCGLLIAEDLLCEQRWNGDRHIAFAAEGMLETRAALADGPVVYLPIIADRRTDLLDLLGRLIDGAAEMVTDDIPAYLVPELNQDLLPLVRDRACRLTAIDGNGLVPTRLLVEPAPSAAVFRGYLHKHAAQAWSGLPKARPLARAALPAIRLPRGIGGHPADGRPWLDRFQRDPAAALASLPIDHGPWRVAEAGGRQRGLRLLRSFVTEGLANYDQRREPARRSASGLSPYLHWGQIGVGDILAAVTRVTDAWDPARLPERGGRRLGFWPVPETTQLFLDELLTWRELCHHTAQLLPDFDGYDSLPAWAQDTLAAHADDARTATYTLDQLTQADTHEELWNAAQRELRETGLIHNYLRMLWGKCVLQWTDGPQTAWDHLVELNNRWALDGRNANSYGGIAWCLGRYDHPWQERAVSGTVRYMSPAATRKKIDLDGYLARFGDNKQTSLDLGT